MSKRPTRFLHTSDVHVGSSEGSHRSGRWPELSLGHLTRLNQLIIRSEADFLLIAGDLFDHNRVSTDLVATVTAIFEEACVPVVILPGNHDPYLSDSIYSRHVFPSNVHVLKSPYGQLVALPEVGVQVWGQAHAAYFDFNPIGERPSWQDGANDPLWRIAVAHGLYVRSEYEKHLSYRLYDADLAALEADYIGLGHLEKFERVGNAGAYYSGSLERSGGATLVELNRDRVTVRQLSLDDTTDGISRSAHYLGA